MPKSVLLVAQELTQGGSERQLTETAKALDRTRFTPHVAVFRPGGIRYEELLRAGIPVTVFPFRSFGSPQIISAAWHFHRYLRRHRIQLVHSFDVPANIFAVPPARLSGTPVVLSSQRAFRELAPSRFRPLLRFNDHIVDGVVVNCRALEKHLIEDEEVRPSLIRICYNGIDTGLFYPKPVPRPPLLEGASLVIGIVCALREEKDLPTLIRAFALARARRPDVKLVFVGSGPVLAELERLRGELALGDSCVFAPSTAQVADWLRAIDIFVLPSRSEALSNSLMEAMACGCSVVASRIGGNPELIADGECGLLFEAGDVEGLARQLTRLLTDDIGRRRMAEAASRLIPSKFSVATAASRMAEIYNECLADKSK